MVTDGPNLPVVIQQAGTVSRVQEAAQRTGEVQQNTAANEAVEQRQRERSQVQQTQASEGQNRVRADDESRRQKERRRQGKRKKAKKQTEQAAKDKEGGLVDVII
ncbi:MAG: hypothetical protein PVG60_06795 [Desulfarculaceae bacterium]|jgi:hypothetical protein